jgi:hypothetical protein
MAISLLKPTRGGFSFRGEMAVAQPFQKRIGYKFIAVMCNGHSPTETSGCPFGCDFNSHVTAVAVYRFPKPTALFWCQENAQNKYKVCCKGTGA